MTIATTDKCHSLTYAVSLLASRLPTCFCC